MTGGPDGDALIRRRFVIHGRVQGVFFRASTRRAAQAAGATGWVRNDPDGSVVAEVQGAQAVVDAVERFLHQGPPQAHVRSVERTQVDLAPGEGAFDVVG